jgi:hypothetical protein
MLKHFLFVLAITGLSMCIFAIGFYTGYMNCVKNTKEQLVKLNIVMKDLSKIVSDTNTIKDDIAKEITSKTADLPNELDENIKENTQKFDAFEERETKEKRKIRNENFKMFNYKKD